VIRSRSVAVKPGQAIEVDFRKADPKNPDKFHIRYVPTPEDVVEAMCKLAKVGKNDVVYDLGCGDGRIVIAAVNDFHAKRGVGVDIDEDLVKLSKEEAKNAKVEDRVSFRKQDVLEIKDMADASVVMLYMGEDVNLRLRPILQKSLKPGSRIVSHDFNMGDWAPDKKITVYSNEDGDDHELYLWTIK
jgi:cyclopropane fatty-acyl-phospholipid synthase-like methyltransferase